ncbi:hypothetical protein SLS60_007208 [Paraconiothyrium brasiliense]|uniref:Rhodopsin domain-containing protein n=1 Tax=Paraconiothyrium brasiliense TaxID=300254 RepID=A0ABR3R8Q2_9PLEO
MSTAEPTTTPLPSGVSPPPEIINSEDQSGVIAIIAGFALGLVLLAACIKVYVRKYFFSFRHDDITFALAVTSVIIQNSLVFYQIHDGLGVILPKLTLDQKMTIRKAGLAADLFYIVILFLSKLCCTLFFLWLAPDGRHKNVAWIMIGASAFARWVYIGVFDMAIELALFLTSLYLIWNRHIPLASRLAILGAFACRLPNIALTILRLVFLNMTLTPENSAYWKSRVACTTQMAIGWTIFSCVIPYLRPIITAYERDGMSSKSCSSRITEPFSLSLRMEPRRQSSLHHPEAARTIGFDLRNPSLSPAERDEDSITRMSRGSGRGMGGIEKTVKIELKEDESASPRPAPHQQKVASGATV